MGTGNFPLLLIFAISLCRSNTFVEKLSFPAAAERMLQVLALAYVMFTLAHKGIMIDNF